jgi:HSP20 family protein
MDRLFDSFMGGLPTFPSMFGPSGTRGFGLTPSLDVKETDKDIVVEAELPGLEDKDISLTMQNGVLTIKGEKRLDHDEQREDYHVMERRYGSFQRSLQVPDTVDEDKVDARFENGVLTITLPKRPEAAKEQRKIDIKKG